MNGIQSFNTPTLNSESPVSFAGTSNIIERINSNTVIPQYPVQINATKSQNKQNLATTLLGIFSGFAVSAYTVMQLKWIKPWILPKLQEMGSVSEKNLAEVDKAAEKVLQKTGLTAKGFKIIKATHENVDKITDSILKAINNVTTKITDKIFGKQTKEQRKILKKIRNRSFKKLSDNMYREKLRNTISMIADGKNACCVPVTKRIIMPQKKLSLTVFHEIGHAMNANFGALGKTLSRARAASLLVLPIALTALIKKKKAPGEEPKGNFDKATTFVKNNAGKLTFAALLPMVLEEGLASIRGYGAAKNILNPKLAKKIPLTYTLAFSTYLSFAILSAIGINLGIKVKDAIIENKTNPI